MDSFFTSFLGDLSVSPEEIQIIDDSAKLLESPCVARTRALTSSESPGAKERRRYDVIDTITQGLLLAEADHDMDVLGFAPQLEIQTMRPRKPSFTGRKTRNAKARATPMKAGKLGHRGPSTTLMSAILSLENKRLHQEHYGLPPLTSYASIKLDPVQ